MIFLLFSGVMCSCTVPKIIILDDPLSAAEHNDLGVAYENKGMFDLAEKEYAKALKKEDHWAVPHFNLGNLYYRIGEYENAERSYRKAIDLEKNNPDALNNLAYLLYEQGRYEEAKAMIEKALAIERNEEYMDTERRILEKIGSQQAR